MTVRYGYACINRTLREHDVRTNRDMKQATFDDDTELQYTAELCVSNLKGLLEVLEWNVQHDIYVFRITSMPFPWFTEWSVSDLPDDGEYTEHDVRAYANEIATFVQQHDIRLTMHPGHYCCLASPTDSTYHNAVDSLKAHARFFDLLEQPRSPHAAINIHIGGTYDDKEATLWRFGDRYQQLPDAVRSRLVVENDDTQSQFSVQDLYRLYREVDIPVTFDYHHHHCHPGSLNERSALHYASRTWPDDVRQLTHYSESHPDKSRPQAHSEYVQSLPDDYGKCFDCIVEAKGKEQAVIEQLS